MSRRSWKRYGGRGIEVCPRWLESFENFAEDVDKLGEIPWGAKFDRIDNDGNYEPGNVRWADDFVSNRNKSNARWQEWKGQIMTMTDIACMENVNFNSFRNKVFISGMTLAQAVEDCRKRGLLYKERAKGKRPQIT